MGLQRLILIILAMSVLTSCRNQTIIDSQRPASLLNEDEKKEIVIWHTYSEGETKVFENDVIPLFEQEHPAIDIKPVRQSYNEQLNSAIVARASANKPPDIVRMDMAWLPKFAALDLLYPVSTFEDFGEIKDSFYQEPLKSTYYAGEYYGLPLNTNTKVAIYNKQLLERYGNNKPPETMEELIEIIVEHDLTIGMLGLTPWESLPYFYGLGGALTDPTYTKSIGYLDSKDSIAAVKSLLHLYQQSNLTPNVITGNAQTWQGILTGNYFMIDEGPWFYSINSLDQIEFIEENTISAPFPFTNGYGSILGGENLVLLKGTKQREEAWTFMKWMTTEKPQKMMFQTGLIPSNKEINLSEFFERYPYYESYVASLDHAFLRPQVAQWGRIEEVYTKYFKLIFSGSVGVEDGLKEAAKEIEKLLIKEKGN